MIGWTDYGLDTEAYISGLTLTSPNLYYVSVRAENGAGMMSTDVVTSTPVQIIGGSKKGNNDAEQIYYVTINNLLLSVGMVLY